MPSRRPVAFTTGAQWLERNRLSLPTLAKPASEIARTQRRGRPGITPEFPVCRPEQLLAAGHQARVAECTGGADCVKQRRIAPSNRQGLPRPIGSWKNRSVGTVLRLNL
jgi:hypothetical protein